MKHIKTLAIQIDEENYSLAVACLAGGFATIPLSKVLGCYLVINELVAKTVHGKNSPPVVTLGNSWYQPDLFNDTYEVDDDNYIGTGFFEVTKISH